MNPTLANGNLRESVKTASQFVWLIPHLTRICQEQGYGMGVHGSMNRDLDIIACPWEDNASAAEVLVKAILDGVGGYFKPGEKLPFVRAHGRLGWPIYLHRDFYIDLSVMPRLCN